MPLRALVISVILVAPAAAHAAACCMSSSVLGVGRLAIWENAGAGLMASYEHTTGTSDAFNRTRALTPGTLEDGARFDAWTIVRLTDAWQLTAKVPWVVGVRSAGDVTSVGQGVGDITAGARWDIVQLGEYAELPGVAVVASVTAPTGRRPEQATDELGASATGRGAWQLAAGFALERAVVPWFIRLDVGFTYFFGFRRVDTQQWQQLGPGLQAAFSGGYELKADTLVLAASVKFDHELPYSLAGTLERSSSASSLSLSTSLSWKVTSHVTLTAAIATDVAGRLGLARNRPELLSGSLGARYAFF